LAGTPDIHRDLRKVFDRVMIRIEETNGETVTLHEDYFYSVPFPEIYDIVDPTHPPELTIGQLTESWEFLQRTKTADETVAFEAVWIGDLLKAIGHLANA
jgi:hypothetical protein